MRTPEQILDAAPKKAKEVRIEANVVAYFGDLLMAWKRSVSGAAAAAKRKN
jgi:hypothetical protein